MDELRAELKQVRIVGRGKMSAVVSAFMWQPNRAQWPVIWTTTVLLIVAWPPAEGRSLLVKTLNWAVDPAGSLTTLPPPLPLTLDDDGDVVAIHDAQETEYYRQRDSSATTRWRMTLKEARDPFDPLTERQVLVGVAALSVLGVWRLNKG